MFILDTNVVSELRKAKAGKADANVVAWAEDQDPSALFLSAITLLELEMGVRQMERRDSTQGAVLRAWMADRVLPVFEGRIWPLSKISSAGLRMLKRAGRSAMRMQWHLCERLSTLRRTILFEPRHG
jgi:predicted nucleic acid-binding protein